MEMPGVGGIEMSGVWTRKDADRVVRAARRLLAQAEAETAGAARIAHCEARLSEAIAIRDRY